MSEPAVYPLGDVVPQSGALRPIPSSWGHAAGRGTNPADNQFIDAALRELLSH